MMGDDDNYKPFKPKCPRCPSCPSCPRCPEKKCPRLPPIPQPVPHGHHDPHVPPSGNCQNGPVNKKNKKKCEQEYGGAVNCLKDNDWYFWCEGGNHNLSVTDINGVTNCTCS